MGYDADIIVFKKKTLENIQKIFPDFTFHELYTDYLFTRINPLEYDVSEDEKATWIFSPQTNIFDEFLKEKLENGDARIIEKETYFQFFKWIEETLKKTTLYDLVDTDKDESYVGTLINTYKNMKNKPIDFETEFVVFQHDW